MSVFCFLRALRLCDVREPLTLYETGSADFADYLIGLSQREQGAEVTFTFDRRAADCRLFQLVD